MGAPRMAVVSKQRGPLDPARYESEWNSFELQFSQAPVHIGCWNSKAQPHPILQRVPTVCYLPRKRQFTVAVLTHRRV